MSEKDLRGWKYIVYTLIKSNFRNQSFKLNELYSFEPYFAKVYPENKHIKDKLRQVLQQLRDIGLISFLSTREYQLLLSPIETETPTKVQDTVYLLSNQCIPGWVKIGRTNEITRRLKELYNTSVPLPFILEDKIDTSSLEESRILEKSIHSVIDTLNPKLRKSTEANKREFFNMSIDEGKNIFQLVSKIINIKPSLLSS